MIVRGRFYCSLLPAFGNFLLLVLFWGFATFSLVLPSGKLVPNGSIYHAVSLFPFSNVNGKHVLKKGV